MITTDCSALAGVSFGSVKPKLAAVNVSCVSSLVVTVVFVPAGASFTRRDVDGERVRRRVEIDAAVGRPPVVAHLEREASCRGTRWHSPRA